MVDGRKRVVRKATKQTSGLPSLVNERFGDFAPTEAGIRAGEQLMGVECPVWPFLVNLPA